MKNTDITPAMEIITGVDALNFLYSNTGIRSNKDSVFSKLFSKMNQERTIESRTPTNASMSHAFRKKRKDSRPSRIPKSDEFFDPSPIINSNKAPSRTQVDKRGRRNNSSRKTRTKANCRKLLVVKGDKKELHSLSPSRTSIICKNLACQAVLHPEVSFCRRCSCCICKEFDDNKDPSLWISCDVDEGGCGLSCHVECALQSGVVGVISLNTGSAHLDGVFNCKPCGRISSLIRLWKRQLLIAKEARRVDVLYRRFCLSHRLLHGTVKYKSAYSHLDKAVKILESEVALMNKGSLKLDRCITTRLFCNAEVQELIDLALEQVESLGNSESVILDVSDSGTHEEALRCDICFEDICSTSIVLSVVDNRHVEGVVGYRLWHRKSTDHCYLPIPSYMIPKSVKKVVVPDLQPNTSYIFKLIPFSSDGDQEESEAECCTGVMDSEMIDCEGDDFTQAGELMYRKLNHEGVTKGEDLQYESSQRGTIQGISDRHGRHSSDLSNDTTMLARDIGGDGKGDLFLSQTVVQTGHTVRVGKSTTACMDDDVTSHGELGERETFSFEAHDNISYCQERAMDVEMTDDSNTNSTYWALQVHGHSSRMGMVLHENTSGKMNGPFYGNCDADFCRIRFTIRVVRWLEFQGFLDRKFGMKFLTWYSLRATEHEKRAVSIFIDTLRDSPLSLAAQLVDAFQDIIESKR
ncbi:hypothetical protein KP509_21G044600 [Ceratopteris richardii]|uniref:Uncharacterized protein n=1 Tax=Ceratopteris richardii TaxID=49495 RepID=A0A8T2SCU3_CERRI|nr:hypothetical protein KP509_21G044600 [Ceratopteris richardii]KAH7315331.1 hypothetical protein KP509_21G044600 [Ceratopteris richardii]KAH7315332.1 hypothetical protein KP509_21G044600 [Ceratopteris richardii]